MINLERIKKVHFIGVGGIMMSALALYFLHEGKEVTGSDRDKNDIVDNLIKKGVKFYKGHERGNIDEDVDLVIFTVAIDDSNSELAEALGRSLVVRKVYDVIGQITRKKKTIAVSGMHGKSTVTAMSSLMMVLAGLDPTVFIGTKIKEWDSNFRFGEGEYLISESCEYKDNFLSYSTDVLLINNIEEEHLDYFGDLDGVFKSFKKLIANTKDGGVIIANIDDDNVTSLIKKIDKQVVRVSLAGDDRACLRVGGLKENEIGCFDFVVQSRKYKEYDNLKISLKVPGEFNVYNALMVSALGAVLKIDPEIIKKSLEDFSGTWRRFEYRGEKNGVEYYDDYAHHPTEIRATLGAIEKKFQGRRVWLVFQPHLFSRTRLFFDEFIEVFSGVDNLVFMEIYPAREENKWGISSRDLVETLHKKGKDDVYFVEDVKKAREFISKKAKKGDVVFTMGAGVAVEVGEW